MDVRLIVAYRGAAYAGWQRQKNALAVQQVLEEALARVLVPDEDPRGRPVHVVAASRTDAGVHARAQAVHLRLAAPFPLRGLVHGAEHYLPEDVRVVAAERVAEGFHARRHARAKEYRYRLRREAVLSPLDALFSVRERRTLDMGALAAATAQLPGRHDFTAFALAGGAHTHPHRTILTAEWEARGTELTFTIVGEGFLRGMVRGLVGTLLEVAAGRRTVAEFAALLDGQPRSAAGRTALARGLTLERVLYPKTWRALESWPPTLSPP